MSYSVLFPRYDLVENMKDKHTAVKPYFNDLDLDLIFNPIIKSNQKYDLVQYYYEPLQDTETIYYRQEVMRDLENLELRNSLADFSKEVYTLRQKMVTIREKLSPSAKWSNNYLIRGHMLDYAEIYCQAITKLKENLSKLTINSDGILNFQRYIIEYVETERYQNLTLVIENLREAFSEIEYLMYIDGDTIKVKKYEGQEDYSKKIMATFEKFRQGDVKDYRHDLSESPKAEHVEVGVLNLLSKLYKDTFADLVTFCSEFMNFDDDTIIQFSKEIQFYLSWLFYIKPLKESGLSFNYPVMEHNKEHISANDSFDLALATKIKKNTVTNDFTIGASESIIVVTGPNQGGKTTYAKMFGQMHYIASLGLNVPGKKSSLYIFDTIYTHFGKEEDLSTQDGKLKDDLVRLYEVTSNATEKSLIIINEIFSSTTVNDAVSLGSRMMDKLLELGAPALIVTFLDELALHSKNAISMMSTVKDDDPTARTYKIVRRPPDGAAYAIHIASKHNLTYEKLSRRLDQ